MKSANADFTGRPFGASIPPRREISEIRSSRISARGEYNHRKGGRPCQEGAAFLGRAKGAFGVGPNNCSNSFDLFFGFVLIRKKRFFVDTRAIVV
jgi:hypothetical protein